MTLSLQHLQVPFSVTGALTVLAQPWERHVETAGLGSCETLRLLDGTLLCSRPFAALIFRDSKFWGPALNKDSRVLLILCISFSI